MATVAGSDTVEANLIHGHECVWPFPSLGSFRSVQGARWRLQTEKRLVRRGGDSARAIAAGVSGSRSSALRSVSVGGGGASSAKARDTRWKRAVLQVTGAVRCEQARDDLCNWKAACCGCTLAAAIPWTGLAAAVDTERSSGAAMQSKNMLAAQRPRRTPPIIRTTLL